MKDLKIKFNMKTIATLTILTTFITKIKYKLKEQNGADGSTEKGGWIIIALIVVGLAIAFINGFFPDFFDGIGDKLMEMFNLIKTS